MLAFHISDFKTTVSANPLEVFADKMQEYTRVKNREFEQLRKERDFERAEKERVMRGMEELVINSEKREGLALQKMSLLLNSKKAKIMELKLRIEDL